MEIICEDLEYRFEVIGKATKYQEYTNKQAADALGLCVRQIIRLKNKFDGSMESLKHGNYNNEHARRYSEELITKVVNLVQQLNQTLLDKGFKPMNYHHALVNVLKTIKYDISYSSFVKMMHEHGILSHRSFATNLGNNAMHLPSASNQKVCGEEWQADGTFKFRINENAEEYCVHLIVDNATNVMIAAFVDYEETTVGYLNAMKKGFEKYGIPLGFATDKRGTFYNLNSKEDRLTTVTRILDDLNVSSRVTSNPRSKNKVESKNAIVKDWVMKEIALRNLSTIEEVNELLPEILDEVNKALNNTITDDHVHRKMPDHYKYDLKFAKTVLRKMSKNNTISYGGVEYVLVHDNTDILKKRAKSDVKLYINYKGDIFHSFNNKIYELVLATREMIQGLELEAHMKIKRILGREKKVFSWNKKTYHLVDNAGVTPTFDERKELEVYYTKIKKITTLKIAKVDGIVYDIKAGYPYTLEDEYGYELAYTKNSLVNYGGIDYELHDMGCNRYYPEKDTQIMLEIKNKAPIMGTLLNRKYILIPHQE